MDPSKPIYSIGDLASQLGVTTRTIRFYEDEGMLAPHRAGGQRIYGPRDLARPNHFPSSALSRSTSSTVMVTL